MQSERRKLPPDGPNSHDGRGFTAHRQKVRDVAAAAARQHGVVSLDQLAHLGMSERAVHDQAAAGRLHRIHQGVYAVGHPLLSANGYRMAAVLACGPEAVLSHRSAAALWGIRRDTRDRIDVTAPGRRGRIPEGIDAHRHGSLRVPDRSCVDGIPCTSLAKTLLDLAAVVTLRELRNAVTQSEVQRIFDLGEMVELLKRSRGRRGVARLRLAIDHHDPRAELAREELEQRFIDLCARAALPPPEVNPPLLLEGVPIEPDFLWRDLGLIVETDGHRTHGTRTAFERDRRRDQHLKRAGWEVIRCTWRQVLDDPADLGRTIRAVLHRRRASNAPM